MKTNPKNRSDAGAAVAEPAVWGAWGTFIWAALIGAVFVGAQMAVVGIYVSSATAGRSDAEAQVFLEWAISDGDVLSWATIVSALVCTALTFVAVAFKRGSSIKHALGLYPVDKKSIVAWTLLFIALLIVLDIGTSLLDRPITPDVMRQVYDSADSKLLLFLATVVAAAVFEELFFRGFVMEGFSRSPIGPWGSVVLSAGLWSFVHVQYDAYGIVTVFAIGLFLGAAKLRTGSTFFAMILHALNNAIAFFFLMLLSASNG